MDRIWPYFGNLHEVIQQAHWADVILVVCAILCGLMVGAERERRQKPAGLRTVMLICVGSTIYTLASLLVAGQWADPGRIAAQVVTGVGFLGAGAIIRDRGNVIGLTTGATIWAVAAIGVMIGAGYAAAGIVLSIIIVAMLTLVRWIDHVFEASCRMATCTLTYEPNGGKTQVRLLRVLDEFNIPDRAWDVSAADGRETMRIEYCHYHKRHRAFLSEVVRISGIIEIQRDRAARETIGADEDAT